MLASKRIFSKLRSIEGYQNPDTARRAHFDALLDDALDASFPASDPIAINFSSARRTAPLK